MPTCRTCQRDYDNGTNALHGCDPLDMLRDFQSYFGKLSSRDVLERIQHDEAAIELLSLYARVRRMFRERDEARPCASDAEPLVKTWMREIDASLPRVHAELREQLAADNACPAAHSGKHEPHVYSDGVTRCDHCDETLAAAGSSGLDPDDYSVELSRRAQAFGYEHCDCNPNGANVMNAVFRLLADVRRETIEAAAKLVETLPSMGLREVAARIRALPFTSATATEKKA